MSPCCSVGVGLCFQPEQSGDGSWPQSPWERQAAFWCLPAAGWMATCLSMCRGVAAHPQPPRSQDHLFGFCPVYLKLLLKAKCKTFFFFSHLSFQSSVPGLAIRGRAHPKAVPELQHPCQGLAQHPVCKERVWWCLKDLPWLCKPRCLGTSWCPAVG